MSNFLTPQELSKAFVEISRKKAELPLSKMIALGILAGVYIGFGSHLFTTVMTGAVGSLGFGPAKFLGGAVFSVGLMLVIIAGAELFTGNTLMAFGIYTEKLKIGKMFKAWGTVYFANLLGALLLAFLIFAAGINGAHGEISKVGETAVSIAQAKVELSSMQIFFRGILANWLVCLAVMMAISAKDITGKIFACFFPIMAFVAMGFEHSVANMYFLPAGIFSAQGTVASLTITAAIRNILFATLGNIVGGSFFVAWFYWQSYLKK